MTLCPPSRGQRAKAGIHDNMTRIVAHPGGNQRQSTGCPRRRKSSSCVRKTHGERNSPIGAEDRHQRRLLQTLSPKLQNISQKREALFPMLQTISSNFEILSPKLEPVFPKLQTFPERSKPFFQSLKPSTQRLKAIPKPFPWSVKPKPFFQRSKSFPQRSKPFPQNSKSFSKAANPFPKAPSEGMHTCYGRMCPD